MSYLMKASTCFVIPFLFPFIRSVVIIQLSKFVITTKLHINSCAIKKFPQEFYMNTERSKRWGKWRERRTFDISIVRVKRLVALIYLPSSIFATQNFLIYMKNIFLSSLTQLLPQIFLNITNQICINSRLTAAIMSTRLFLFFFSLEFLSFHNH